MLRNAASALLILTITLTAGFCSGASRKKGEATDRASAVSTSRDTKGRIQIMQEKKIASAYSDFGIELLKRVSIEEKGNILISPASVAFALSMTINGARGNTYAAIAKTLRLEDMNIEALNSTNNSMIEGMSSLQEGVELRVANSLWCRKDLSFKKDFIAANTRYYGATVEALDFSNPTSKEKINDWVKDKTGGKIPKIIETIKKSDILFLINAIYFKGKWAREFDKGLTKEEIFHSTDGSEKKVPMMRRSGRFPYVEMEDFQGVMIPYKGKRIAMFLFLPPRETNVKEFIGKLKWEELSKWFKGFLPRKGEIIFPKFRFDYRASLKDILSDLGMRVAFDRTRAELSGMIEVAGKNAFISDVIHKAFIEVSEEGTEAAAATSVSVGLTSAIIRGKPFVFKADRPFLFFIRDNKTGLILFEGIVADPSE